LRLLCLAPHGELLEQRPLFRLRTAYGLRALVVGA
jgi:hypothetical protein